MNRNFVCDRGCRAYNKVAYRRCELMQSMKKMSDSMGTLAQASGVYTQNAEAAWHR